MGPSLIRDRKNLERILSISDAHPSLTSKYFYYPRLKRVYDILEDSNLTKLEKDQLIRDVPRREDKPAANYKSPARNQLMVGSRRPCNSIRITSGTTSLDIKKVMSKGRVVGFTEAEGSFYLTRKDTSKIVHGPGITQKSDPIVPNGTRQTSHTSSKVKYRKKHNFYMLDTTRKRSIENICTYSQGNLVGMKSFEFEVWKRSLKYRNHCSFGAAKLLKIQQTLRSLRPQRFLPEPDEASARWPVGAEPWGGPQAPPPERFYAPKGAPNLHE